MTVTAGGPPGLRKASGRARLRLFDLDTYCGGVDDLGLLFFSYHWKELIELAEFDTEDHISQSRIKNESPLGN